MNLTHLRGEVVDDFFYSLRGWAVGVICLSSKWPVAPTRGREGVKYITQRKTDWGFFCCLDSAVLCKECVEAGLSHFIKLLHPLYFTDASKHSYVGKTTSM